MEIKIYGQYEEPFQWNICRSLSVICRGACADHWLQCIVGTDQSRWFVNFEVLFLIENQREVPVVRLRMINWLSLSSIVIYDDLYCGLVPMTPGGSIPGLVHPHEPGIVEWFYIF